MFWAMATEAALVPPESSDVMEEKPLCPECGEEMIPTQEVDDARGGTVTILYWFCPKCGCMIRRWM